MAGLRVDVPLAALDDTGEDAEFSDFQSGSTRPPVTNGAADAWLDSQNNNPAHELAAPISNGPLTSSGDSEETFNETFSGSLEDLVSSFDEKISKCFKSYTETTERFAPVQVRTQEEIMNECQIWWTLTGNFGNILPIDWSKSYARKLHLPALNLREPQRREPTAQCEVEEEDDELAQALDLHSLIVSSLTPHDLPPTQTADQVIQEIDEIMTASEMTGSSDVTMDSGDSVASPVRLPFPLLLSDPEIEAKMREASALTSSEEKLSSLSYAKLQTLNSELESLIQVYNETLVQELALRDELEFEKELKNTFISLLLNVQNKRRQYVTERKRKGVKPMGGQQPQYLTAVIPFEEDGGPPSNQQLQALCTLLKAVAEDNPNVPSLITDYILNGKPFGLRCHSCGSASTDAQCLFSALSKERTTRTLTAYESRGCLELLPPPSKNDCVD